MSAIMGIIDKAAAPISMPAKTIMKARLMHHARDGQKYYENDGCFLGHHRLITNNHQRNDALPLRMDNLVITSYANISNRIPLAKQLGLRAENDAISDPLLILEAFRKWGKDCVNRFEGEFAFAIWNETERSLFAACDHVGLRPFYYYNSRDLFVFSTEIKAVLAAKPEPHIFDEYEVISSTTKQYTEQTFVKEVNLLLAGHTLTIDSNGRLKKEKYWNLEPQGRYSFKTNAEWGECLRQLVKDFLSDKMDTEGQVGIMLSGGLDSSFIAAVAADILKDQNKTLHAFSARLPDTGYREGRDERYYQDLLARHIPNLEMVHIQPPTEIGPLNDLEKTAYQVEAIPNLYHYLDTEIYSAAKNRNVSVLLNGFMGDLAVSRRRYDVVYRSVLDGKLNTAIELFSALKKNYGLSVPALLKTDLFQHFPVWKWLRTFRDHIVKKERSRGFSDTITRHITEIRLNDLFYQKEVEHLPRTVNNGILGHIMTVFDKRAAWFGFEKASPLVNKAVLEFYTEVPHEVHLSRGFRRGLIREAMEGIVPPEIQWRKDKTMYTPDYLERVTAQRQRLEAILNDSAYTPYLYLANKSEIARTLEQINSNPERLDVVTADTIFSVTTACVLKHFSETMNLSLS